MRAVGPACYPVSGRIQSKRLAAGTPYVGQPIHTTSIEVVWIFSFGIDAPGMPGKIKALVSAIIFSFYLFLRMQYRRL